MADNLPVIGKAFRWFFFMADTADGYTGEPSLSPTVTISKAGAAFAALTGAPSVSEVGGAGNGAGWYYVDVPVADMVSQVILKAVDGTAAARTMSERIIPLGDAHQRLTGKQVFSRSGQSISVKQPDGSTEQLEMSYTDIDNDTYSWGQ